MEKEYKCRCAESKGSIMSRGSVRGVYCKISDSGCPCVSYEFPTGIEFTEEMVNCPAYNISTEAAKDLAKARVEKSKFDEEKNLEERLKSLNSLNH